MQFQNKKIIKYVKSVEGEIIYDYRAPMSGIIAESDFLIVSDKDAFRKEWTCYRLITECDDDILKNAYIENWDKIVVSTKYDILETTQEKQPILLLQRYDGQKFKVSGLGALLLLNAYMNNGAKIGELISHVIYMILENNVKAEQMIVDETRKFISNMSHMLAVMIGFFTYEADLLSLT